MAFLRSDNSELPEADVSPSPVAEDSAGEGSLLVLGNSWSKELLLDNVLTLLTSEDFLFFPFVIS